MASIQNEITINPMFDSITVMWAYLAQIVEGPSCRRCKGGWFCETSDAAAFYWERDIIGPYAGDPADDDAFELEARARSARTKKSRKSVETSTRGKSRDEKQAEREAELKARAAHAKFVSKKRKAARRSERSE